MTRDPKVQAVLDSVYSDPLCVVDELNRRGGFSNPEAVQYVFAALVQANLLHIERSGTAWRVASEWVERS